MLYDTSYFQLWSRRMRSPSGHFESDFFYIDAVNWVNVIAITSENEVVMVEQFRHGIQETSLEIPGGMLDADHEDPEEGARRELLEETGFAAQRMESLGFIHPNPAIQSNRNYSYFSENVTRVSSQQLDIAEDIAVHLIPLAEIPGLIESHQITHALVVNAFARLFIRRPELLTR